MYIKNMAEIELMHSIVDYENFVEYTRILFTKYQIDKKVSIYIGFDGNSSCYFETISDFLDEENQGIILSKRVKDIQFSHRGHFSFDLSRHFSEITYEVSDERSFFYANLFVEILQIKRPSIIAKISNIYFLFLLFLPVAFTAYNNNAISLLSSFLFFSLYFIAFMFKKSIFIRMGTRKDIAAIRNLDSIVLSLISLFLGYLLGKYL